LGEGVLTDLLRIVYENIFSNAPKTLYFARDFLMAGIAGGNPWQSPAGFGNIEIHC
jgi:hypothetical protein